MIIRYLGRAFALMLWAATLSPADASPWAEVGDNQLRADIELLEAVGVVNDVTIQWPLPWESLLKDLSGTFTLGKAGKRKSPEKDRLVLMVRDSYWLQAIWTVTRDSVKRAEAALAEHWHTAGPWPAR